MIIKMKNYWGWAWPLCVLLIATPQMVLPFTKKLFVDESQLNGPIENESGPPEPYRLRPGDLLEIYIQSFTEVPNYPVSVYRLPQDSRFPTTDEDGFHLERIDQFFQDGIIPPEKGYVFPVCEDGTIVLPKILAALNVEGMTLEEAQNLLHRAYVDVMMILSSEAVITVSLISLGSHVEQAQSFAQFDEPFFFDPKTKYSLQTVLDHIHEKSSFAVVISDEALKKLGDPQHVTVHARLPFAMPLKDYLDYLVRQQDLVWHFKDGTIHITTTDESSNPDNELIFRAYYIGDLARFDGISGNYGVRDRRDLMNIAEYIQVMATSGIWKEERSLMLVYYWDTIFVNQTEAVHEQIVNLLIFMRKCQVGMSRQQKSDT